MLLPHQTELNDRIVADLLFGETPEPRTEPDQAPSTVPFPFGFTPDTSIPRLDARCIRFTCNDYILTMNAQTLGALHERYQTELVLQALCEKALRPVFDQWNHAWYLPATLRECRSEAERVNLDVCLFINSLFEP